MQIVKTFKVLLTVFIVGFISGCAASQAANQIVYSPHLVDFDCDSYECYNVTLDSEVVHKKIAACSKVLADGKIKVSQKYLTDGSLVLEQTFLDSGISKILKTVKFDEQGRVKSVILRSGGYSDEFSDNTGIPRFSCIKETFGYYSDGHLSVKYVYPECDAVWNRKYEFVYNKTGRLIEKRIYSKPNDLSDFDKYKYTLDIKNRVTELLIDKHNDSIDDEKLTWDYSEYQVVETRYDLILNNKSNPKVYELKSKK